MAGLLGAVLSGGTQGFAKGTQQNVETGQAMNLAQMQIEVRALMDERIAERAITATKQGQDFTAGEAGKQRDFTAAENQKQRDFTAKQLDKKIKPTYPKIIKLKDENDHEYLIDENSGAIGKPVPGSPGLPAESNWFSPDKPAVPATESRIVWTSSNGTALEGGLESLYSQMKPAPASGEPKKGAFDPNKYIAGQQGKADEAGAPKQTTRPAQSTSAPVRPGAPADEKTIEHINMLRQQIKYFGGKTDAKSKQTTADAKAELDKLKAIFPEYIDSLESTKTGIINRSM